MCRVYHSTCPPAFQSSFWRCLKMHHKWITWLYWSFKEGPFLFWAAVLAQGQWCHTTYVQILVSLFTSCTKLSKYKTSLNDNYIKICRVLVRFKWAKELNELWALANSIYSRNISYHSWRNCYCFNRLHLISLIFIILF
jgi:hypothetical protein